MTLRKTSIFCAAGLTALLALTAFGQEETFSDPNVDYSFSIPDAGAIVPDQFLPESDRNFSQDPTVASPTRSR